MEILRHSGSDGGRRGGAWGSHWTDLCQTLRHISSYSQSWTSHLMKMTERGRKCILLILTVIIVAILSVLGKTAIHKTWGKSIHSVEKSLDHTCWETVKQLVDVCYKTSPPLCHHKHVSIMSYVHCARWTCPFTHLAKLKLITKCYYWCLWDCMPANLKKRGGGRPKTSVSYMSTFCTYTMTQYNLHNTRGGQRGTLKDPQ